MSDDEENLSDDSGAGLFESDREDQGDVELGNSVDLPALSMDSLYVGPRLNADEGVGADDKPFENSGGGAGLSGAAGFDISERDLGMASPSPPLSIQMQSNAEDQEFTDQHELREHEGGEQAGNEVRLDATEHGSVDPGCEEMTPTHPSSLAMPQCESPRIPELTHTQNGDDTEQRNHEAHVSIAQDVHHEDSSIQSLDAKLSSTLAPSVDNSNEIEVPTSNDERTEIDEVPMPTTVEPAQTSTADKESEKITTPLSTSETEEQQQQQQPGVAKAASIGLSTAPIYTVESLFPVVYESSRSSLRGSPTANAKVVPISASPSAKPPSQGQRRQVKGSSNPDKSIGSRLAALQSQRDAARAELKNATRTFKLQLSMAETDNNKLSQRNARLKTQLAVATADLQRSNAEMAKLETENELYAAKLPRLQAELLEETSQVDETQAQSVQTQLALTQLKARSHVLQTRNLALEARNNKLTQQVRECQQQLQRKAAALQQQTEKATKLESDMNDLKTTHTQEKLDWKSRMTSALQRFERDKTKLETALKSQDRKELRDAKDRAERATKKRQAAESSAAKLEAQLKHSKHELSSANEALQHHINEVGTLEALLRKAHRTEATLRNDLAACKTKLRTLQDEKKRRLARPAAMQPRRRRLEQQIPVELLLPLTDSDDDEDDGEENNQEERCCSHCLTLTKAFQSQSPLCSECPRLKDQVQQLQQDLRRVRALHTAELNAQASVLDALLLQQKRQLAVAAPQM